MSEGHKFRTFGQAAQAALQRQWAEIKKARGFLRTPSKLTINGGPKGFDVSGIAHTTDNKTTTLYTNVVAFPNLSVTSTHRGLHQHGGISNTKGRVEFEFDGPPFIAARGPRSGGDPNVASHRRNGVLKENDSCLWTPLAVETLTRHKARIITSPLSKLTSLDGWGSRPVGGLGSDREPCAAKGISGANTAGADDSAPRSPYAVVVLENSIGEFRDGRRRD